MEKRRTRVRRDALPLSEQTPNDVEIALAPNGRIHEVGERPAAHIRLVGSIRGIVDADEMVVGLAWAVRGESRPAARERDQ